MMLLTDPISMIIMDANKSACNFYGYSKQQMQQLLVTDLTWMSANLMREDIKISIVMKHHRFSALHYLADSTTRFVEVYRSQVMLDGRMLLHSIITDISDKKEEQENLQRLYRATQQSARSVIITDPQGVIEFVNPYVQKLTGYSKKELIGKHTRIFKSGQTSPELYKEMWMALPSGKPWQGRLLNRKKNGDLYWESTSISPVHDDKGVITHYVGYKEDITDKVRLEALEKEVELARHTARFRKDFLATMSHEIRTPVTGIMGMAEILGLTPLDDTQRGYLNILQQSTRLLRGIINQVLDYSKIEAGKMQVNLHPFNLGQLEQNARQLFFSLNSKGLQFMSSTDPNLPVAIEADEQRVEQVINNFVSNAVKFTKQGTITMTTTLEQELDSEMILVKVSVADTGHGIPASLQEHLFRPFGQLLSEGLPGNEGTGLGLSISKELAQMMGGSIGVDSQPGKGSKFWFTFRAKALYQDLKQQQPQKANAGRGIIPSMNILLAEDVLVNQKVISLMLNSLGHRVQVASNGIEALELYRQGAFDLILMDIQMPLMDGITALGHLREKYSQLPPVVGLSANAFEGDREKYMAQGLDDYLTKPLRIEDFKQLIDRMVLVAKN